MNIIGRLTRDAEIHTTSKGKQVVNFSVAVNDNYRTKQGERVEQTAYFACSYWITSKIAESLTKGLLVELTGRVSANAWIGKDGEAHSGLNFHTSQIKFHGSTKKDADNNASKAPTKSKKSEAETDDLPF